MDTTKFAKHDASLAALSLNVMYAGDTLVIVTNVLDIGRPATSFTSRYVPERLASVSHVANATRPDYLRWQGDTLVLRSVHVLPARTLEIEERWNIDPTGTTLSRFQHVVDGKRVSQQTLVFTRE